MSHTLLSVVHGPVYGGAHNQMARLNEPLRKRGFETVALIPSEARDTRARLEQAGIEVLALELRRLRATTDLRTHLRFAARLPREVAAIRRVLAERSINLVQVHGPTNPHAALAARMEHLPVVWQLYDTRTPKALRRLTMPLVVRLADVLMTTGMDVARVHPGALAMRERLVPYVPPVDPGEFRFDTARRASARGELKTPQGDLVIGTVGNLNPSKGHEHLVRAARIVRGRHEDAHLWILGAHSPAHQAYEGRLKVEARVLGDAVRFADPGTGVAELMPGLDIFALASVPRSEGIPTVILEAMSCGLPVVTTDVGSVREVVEEGVNGFVVPPENPSALAAAIGTLADDPDRRLSIGLANRRAVQERYGIDRCVEAHVRAYSSALARATGRRRLVAAPQRP